MIKIRKFSLEDAEILCPKAFEKGMSDGEWREGAEINLKSGPAFTGILDDKVIGSAGIRLDGNKGYVWAVFSEKVKDNKMKVFRSIKVMMDILVAQFNLKELWADSKKGFIESQRLLEHLGFRKELETETHYLYVRK
jgi:RimJ/RimL family protein N-acetyltransferase